MFKKVMTVSMLFAFLLSFSVSAATDEELRKALSGNYFDLQLGVEPWAQMKFNADGTSEGINAQDKKSFKGTWSVANGKLIIHTTGEPPGSYLPKSITKEKLVFAMEGMEAMEFTFVPKAAQKGQATAPAAPAPAAAPATPKAESKSGGKFESAGNELHSCEELKEISDSLKEIKETWDETQKITEGSQMDKALADVVNALEDIAELEKDQELSSAINTLADGYDEIDGGKFESGLKKTMSTIDKLYRRDCK